VGRSGDQVEGLVEAECHALGVGLLELLLAEVGAHLVQAVPAVARFKRLPRCSRSVEEGLRGAVEHGGLAPVTRVRGQAGQAETGDGDTGTVPVAAADPQGCPEAGSRAVGSLYWRRTQPVRIDRSMPSSPLARMACAACCR